MDRDEADKRHAFYINKDPFTNIPPTLLNSQELENYIKTVGIIYPFDDDQLNGITLSLRVGQTALFWDEEKQKVVKDIEKDKEFILKSNTIAYVETYEELRLPHYIIARFNLRVTNAYRGILLGTGPIVDPGFEGKLFIPLHNLTNNEYVFYFKEDFVDMEFTKLNPIAEWTKVFKPPSDLPIYSNAIFKRWKPKSGNLEENRPVEHYIRKANLGRSINSSLPSLKSEAAIAIKKANDTSEKVETYLSRYNIGVIFSFAALLTAMIAIVNIFRADVKELKDKKLEERIQVLEQRSDTLSKPTH